MSGTGIRISSEVVKEALGPSALEPGNDFKLTAWLGGQEDQHKVVVYQGGGQPKTPPPSYPLLGLTLKRQFHKIFEFNFLFSSNSLS